MFNYTKEVIINKVDAEKFVVKDGVIVMPRVGNYKVANILDGKVYKTEPVTGKTGSVKITIPAVTDADILRLTMFLATPNVQFAEFGTPCWEDFGKPIIVEVGAEETPKDGAKRLADAVKLAAGEYVDVAYVKDADNFTITGKEIWMDFQDITLVKVVLGKGDVIDEVATEVGTVAPEKAVAEFGTYDYIIHNLRFPTAPNLRFTPLNADELPVRGARYVQYVFKYIARHNVPGGLSGVDQCVDSITSHVFFVKEGQDATNFQNLFAGLDVKPISDDPKAAEIPSMNPYSAGADAVALNGVKDKVTDLETRVAALEA